MGGQTPATAQMSLGKSAWQTPPTSLKILKVGGTRQLLGATRNVAKVYVHPHQEQIIKRNIHETLEPVYSLQEPVLESFQPSQSRENQAPGVFSVVQAQKPVLESYQPSRENFALPTSATTQKDPHNIWGDDPTQIESSQDFDLLFNNIPITILPEKDSDSIDEMWSSEEALDIGDFFEEPSTINYDEMLMVDPREIEGGMEIEDVEVTDNISGDLEEPVFDLLDFVFTNTVGVEDQTFRSVIDDTDLFVQDEAEQAEFVHCQESMHLLSTIDAGGLDLLSAVNSGQISLLNAVNDDQYVASPQAEPALPVVPKQEEIEVPPKKTRGRPRVPRTTSLKPLPR
jgi:hypothetical protein